MQPRTKPPAPGMDSPLGIGPHDIQPPSERERRIREVFLERHAAAVIEAVEAGRMGAEMRKQWRRHKTNGEKYWPLTERRRKRGTK